MVWEPPRTTASMALGRPAAPEPLRRMVPSSSLPVPVAYMVKLSQAITSSPLFWSTVKLPWVCQLWD